MSLYVGTEKVSPIIRIFEEGGETVNIRIQNMDSKIKIRRPDNSLEDFNYGFFSGIVRAVIAADKENAAGRLIVLRKFFRYLDLKLEPEGKFIFGESSPFTRSMRVRKDLHRFLIDGFTPVCYAPYADVPSSDRWILDLSGFEGTSTRLRAGKSYIVDFSGIRSGYYTHLAKVFIWRLKDANIMTRLMKMVMLRLL